MAVIHIISKGTNDTANSDGLSACRVTASTWPSPTSGNRTDSLLRDRVIRMKTAPQSNVRA